MSRQAFLDAGVVKSDSFVFLGLVVFLVAWLLPNHYAPWLAAYQDFLSFLAVLSFLLSVVLRGGVFFRLEYFVFLVVLAVIILQAVLGVVFFSGDAFISVFYVLGFVLMLLVGDCFSSECRGRFFLCRWLAVAFVTGAVLSLWVALRQWLLLSGSIWVADLPPGARPFSNFGQPNNFATLLCLGLAGILYLYEKRNVGPWSAGVLAFFLVLGVALSQSRTPWISALVVPAFWFWKLHAYNNARLTLRGISAWVSVYVGCIFLLPVIADLLLLPTYDPLARIQSLERWSLWQQFMFAVWQGPAWGYGWGQIGVAQVAVSIEHPLSMPTEYSHNIVLDILLWNGYLIGGVVVASIAAWLVRLGWHANTAESLFGLIATGFLLIHGMLELPLAYAFFLFPLGLLLGIVTGEKHTRYGFFIPRSFLVAVLVLGLGCFGWVWREYRVIEEDLRLMMFESAKVGSLRAESPAPDVLILSQLREFIRFARTPAHEGMSGAQIDWMRMVSHRYPHASSLFRYALALGLNGQSSLAHEQLLIYRAMYGDARYFQVVESLRVMSEKHPNLVGLLDIL